MKVLQLIILCLTGKVTFGFGNGAPAQACTYMAPGHFMTREHGLPISRRDLRETLFEVNAEIVGGYVRLSVSPTRSVTVAGFVIQARETENASPIGKFELQSQSNDSIAQYMNCNSEFPYSSITHTNSNPKTNLTFLWSPSGHRNVNVTFYATLARNHDVFWVMQPSNEISLNELNGTQGQPVITLYTLSSLLLAFIINL